MALNTIYQLRARQTWGTGGKEQESVFFFDHTAGTGASADLAAIWGTVIGAALNALQTSIMKNYSVDVINMGDFSDFAYVPWFGTGSVTDQTLPPYAALGYTMKLNTRAVRHGSKRFSGIPEGAGNDGVITESGYITKVETMRAALEGELTDAGDTWLPIVVKRVKEPVVGTVPLQYTYRLPETDGELVYGEIVSVLNSLNLTHQTSREL